MSVTGSLLTYKQSFNYGKDVIVIYKHHGIKIHPEGRHNLLRLVKSPWSEVTELGFQVGKKEGWLKGSWIGASIVRQIITDKQGSISIAEMDPDDIKILKKL